MATSHTSDARSPRLSVRNCRIIGIIALTIGGAMFVAATDKTFEGVVSATLTRPGTEPAHFVFTRKANQLRIENTSNKLEPINILDLNAKRLTIVYPHNTTFVNVDLTKRQQQSNGPGMPAGFPPPGMMPPGMQPPGSAAGVGQPSAQSSQVGPNLSSLPSPPPGFPSPPPMPSMPTMHLPGGGTSAPPNPSLPPMPAGIGPGARAGASMPMPGSAAPGMPPMPMPGMFGATELKKTGKTKKIQGFDCTMFTVSSRGESLEIWATNDSTLFPFQLITRDYIGRRFGPQMLEETWPELLHNKGLFPLEATLKMDPGGQERLSFKVDKIESASRTGSKKIDDKLFQPPEKYIEIQAPEL